MPKNQPPPLTAKIGPLPIAVAQNAGPVADRVAKFVFDLAAEIAAKRGVDYESEDGALLTLIVVGMIAPAVERMCPANIDPKLGRLLLTVQAMTRARLGELGWSPDNLAEAQPRLAVVKPAGRSDS